MLKKWSFRNLKIGWKYGLIGIFIFLLLLGSTAIVSLSLVTVGGNIDEMNRRSDRSIQIAEMGTIIREKGIRILSYPQLQNVNLIDEFKYYSEMMNTLTAEIEDKMHTEEQIQLYEKIVENDQEMNQLFLEDIISAVDEEDIHTANIIVAKANNLRTATDELLTDLIRTVDEERAMAVEEAKESQLIAFYALLISMVLSIVIGTILIILVSRSITRNLRKVVVMSNQIAEGNLAVQDLDYNGRDEIGLIAKAMNKMNGNLRAVIQQVAKVSETVNSHSEELTQSTNEVKEGGVQIASTMQELSSGAESQANNASTLSEMMDEFNRKLVEASTRGEDVSKTSDSVLSMGKDGQVLMGQSVNQMNTIHEKVTLAVQNVKELNEETKRISTLIQVIQEIADQTNLLSLNAAIEAARAGEHGKGFAVVADEVRKLAEQVSSSVDEITKIVTFIIEGSDQAVQSLETSYKEVEDGTKQIEVTGETFENINNSVTSMAQEIQSISTTLKELMDNGIKMNESIEEVAAIAEESAAGVEQTAASVQQTSSSMEEIAGSAVELAALSEQLNSQVQRFKL